MTSLLSLSSDLQYQGSILQRSTLSLHRHRLFFVFAALLFFAASLDAAPPSPTPANKDEVVELSPFVVTAKSRGIIPLNGWFRYNRLTGNLKTPVFISASMKRDTTLETLGVSKGEQVIAIDGQKIIGMDFSVIRRLWMETGDVGDPVTITVKGIGENASVFRKLVLKRVAPPPKVTATPTPSKTPNPTL